MNAGPLEYEWLLFLGIPLVWAIVEAWRSRR